MQANDEFRDMYTPILRDIFARQMRSYSMKMVMVDIVDGDVVDSRCNHTVQMPLYPADTRETIPITTRTDLFKGKPSLRLHV